MTKSTPRTCSGPAPMNMAMFRREFVRGDLLYSIEVADWDGNGGENCWNLAKESHDYTDYAKRYGFRWGQARSDTEFAAHLKALFRRMEADGWAETERSLTRRVFRY